MSTLTFLCFSTSVYFGGFAAFFLCPRFRCIPLFCMSAVRLISKEPVCPFLWVSPFFKVSTVWDSINDFRPSAHLLFPLAVINISSNPFSLPCPPYRVHYRHGKRASAKSGMLFLNITQSFIILGDLLA